MSVIGLCSCGDVERREGTLSGSDRKLAKTTYNVYRSFIILPDILTKRFLDLRQKKIKATLLSLTDDFISFRELTNWFS